jgi:NAD(P)-dependent dehydrogenase (short-subunit alcohol dehydrogenase family)
MARLQDKTAIVTGGSGGIGIAVATLFAGEGANVLLVDLDETALRQAVASIPHESVSYIAADVTRPEQVEQYVRTAVSRYGGVDILVNNAGIEGEVNPIPDYSIETFDRVIAVNVRGVWLGLKYVIPEMRRRGGGSIVITSSVAGIKGTAGIAAYTASKHAVIGLMRTASLECAADGIRVNTVNPAPIETRMIRSLEQQFAPEDPEQAREARMKRIPLQRYGSPDEVARIMLFLASDESSYCTGGVYMVDGGISAGG